MSKALVKIPDEMVARRIFSIRGEKVMLVRDLAKLYGVETKVLEQRADRYLYSMAPEKMSSSRPSGKPSRKPKVSDEQLLRSLITSFSIEGIALSLEEARDLLRKAKLSLGKQPG